jgi:DeoR family fructose operon transcriptional repressor
LFGAERINQIKKILSEKKQIDVTTLSNFLSVSEVTIRRDFEKLENEGFLLRSHGGAILNEDNEYETDFDIPPLNSFENYKEQNIIGKICSYQVEDNDTLFIGPGTIGRFIAKNLENKKNIQVLTTDMTIALQFSKIASNKQVILIGGDVDFINYQVGGKITEDILKSFHVKTAFVEVDGVSIEHGYTVSNTQKAININQILSIASNTIAVCDYTKFNNVSFINIGSVSLFKCIISNEQAPEEYKNFFFNHDIKFFTTFDVYKGVK